MLRIIIKQSFILLLSIIGLSFVFFFITYLLPGGPLSFWHSHLAQDTSAYIQIEQSLKLNQSIIHQYIAYVEKILQGDWGISKSTHTPVFEELIIYFPATVELGFCAILLALIIGIPAGVYAATHRDSWMDSLVITSTLIGYSMPIFWWSMLLILFFSLTLGFTPVAGRIDLVFDIEPITGFILVDTLLASKQYGLDAFFNALKHLILPIVVMATVPLAVIARITRSSMLEVLSSDYILTARSKGLSQFRIVWVHGLRNALVTIVTIVGLQSSIVFTSAILTETLFAWPGIGKWTVDAILRKDYPVIHGSILIIALTITFIHIFVDILHGYLNPRLRKPK